MSRGVVRMVDLWPNSGWPDEPWTSDPGADAFVKSGRSVTEVYSIGLPALELPAWRNWVRFGCGGPAAPDNDVHVKVVVDRLPGDFDFAYVALPDGIADLSPETRALLVLDVIHAGMLRLGASRGWDAAALEGLRAQTLDRGLEYKSDGPWKTAPNRRERARARFRIAPDGFGRARIEVESKRDDAPAVVSEEGIATGISKVWANTARELAWHDNDKIELTTFRRPGRNDGWVRLQRTDGQWRSQVGNLSASLLPLAGISRQVGAARRPRVVAVGDGVEAPESPPRITVVGGGPMNGVPAPYIEELTAQLAVFADEAGQDWWLAAGIKELEVSYYFGGQAEVRLRRRGELLRAEIRRGFDTLLGVDDKQRIAQEDVRALIAAVKQRTGLGEHPAFPVIDR